MTQNSHSDKPFPEAVTELLEERDWSIRELSRHVRSESGWGALSTIHFMVRGDMPPSETGLKAISHALRVKPEHFAEYRLLKARESLDPEKVGVRRALKALDE
jgi:hypothetical protein